ncbi:MAG: YbhB/YbcL family Raf kinase inhibitor-like protein [Anaerolineales bacterium]|jgi:Raf kinase inhibitor-like YbhB/YbcL family protein
MSRSAQMLCLVILGVIILGACVPNPEPAEVIGPTGSENALSAGENDQPEKESNPNGEGEIPMEMALTSPSFNNGEPIPAQFTCDGEDISPDLDWFGTPSDTVSLALIMDDPDAPVGTWVHWVIYDLPFDVSGLRQGMDHSGTDGLNSWNETGYGGPCPPSGTHRYYFKIYALDTELKLNPGADKETLLAAMEGHVIGQAELMGTYSR